MKKIRNTLAFFILISFLASFNVSYAALDTGGPPPPTESPSTGDPTPPPESLPPIGTIGGITTEVSLPGTSLPPRTSAPPSIPTLPTMDFQTFSVPTRTAIISSTIFIGLSPLLYTQLTTQDFSSWANLNAMIYLLLLLLNFGLFKSISRFAPEFAQDRKAYKKFIKSIITFKLLVLLVGLIILAPLLKIAISAFNLSATLALLPLGLGLFFAEGIASTMKLMYYANFRNKQFDLLARTMLMTQLVTNLVLIAGGSPSSENIVYIVLLTKIASGVLLAAISLFMLTRRQQTTTIEQATINASQLKRNFIQYSGFMWGTSTIKSLSGHNALLPLFTITIGPAAANLFKVSHDGAKLFYKAVLRTIGAKGSVEPGNIEMSKKKKKKSGTDLLQKIVILSAPLAILIGGFAIAR